MSHPYRQGVLTMVYVHPTSTPPYLQVVPEPCILDADTSPTALSTISFSTQLRSALTDLKQTLHPLETSSTPSQKRFQVNTLTVQLNGLDALLETAIALLQPIDRRYLSSDLLPDTSLEDIRSLFIEITQLLQSIEIDR